MRRRLRSPRLAALAALVVLLLVTTGLRLQRLDLPLERDEGEYAYTAQLLLDGVAPFEAAYSMKMPGMAYLAAGLMAVGGESAAALRVGLVGAVLVAALLLVALGRELLGPAAGALAGGSYAILALLPSVLGLFAHATQFLVPAALAGLLLLLGRGPPRPARAFAAGLAMGAAYLLKQHAAPFVVLGGLVAIFRAGAARERATRGAAYALGALAPLAAVLVHLGRAGALERAAFWTVEYAARYAALTPPLEGLVRLLANGGALLGGAAGLLWLLAGLGLVRVVTGREGGRARRAILGLAAASGLALLPGLYFRPHYFVLLLPVASLLAATGLCSVARLLPGPPALTRIGAPLGLVAAGLLVGASHAGYLLLDPPARVSHRAYPGEFFPETRRIAERVRAASRPGDRVAVLGSEPQVYFYGGRRAATGYLYTYPLLEPHPYVGRMRRELIGEIERARPRLLLFFSSPNSWGGRPRPDGPLLRWLRGYLRGYRRIGLVELRPGGESRFRWGEAARSRAPDAPAWCLVYRRRPGAGRAE